MSFSIKGIHHLGIAPKDLKVATDFFSKHLNLSIIKEEVVKKQKVSTTIFSSQNTSEKHSETETHIELLEGLSEDSPISVFLKKKGSGVHHMAIEVDNIQSAFETLQSAGIHFVGDSIQKGANETQVIFIHPKSTGGILVELVQNS